MKRGLKIARISGIDVRLHYSWWIIFIFLSWALSSSFFPNFFAGYSTKIYWIMGVTSALLLFFSVLLHELSHSLVARTQKIKVESITLFFFGGVAGITDEDIKPGAEFAMAVAGPLFSLFLAGLFYLLFRLDGHYFLTAITFYLYQINLILAIFNLIPGFPLDGGRAFRALLTMHYKDIVKSTRIAAKVGRFVAGVLIFLGFMGLFTGRSVGGGGLWFVLIGGFLYFIAGISYEQVVLKSILSKVPLKGLINKKVTILSPQMKLSQFLDKFRGSEQEIFLIKDDANKFLGILDLSHLPPLSKGKNVQLKQLALPVNKIALSSKMNAHQALQKLLESGVNMLPVIDGQKYIGVVSKSGIMSSLMWEMRLQQHGGAAKLAKKHK